MAKKKIEQSMVDEKEMAKHASQFDEGGKNMWDKIARFGKSAGAECIYYVLLLYYALGSKDVKPAAKALIIGALGYFISPLDLIPDVVVGFGFIDDLSALVFALTKISTMITPDVKDKARGKLKELGFDADSFTSKY